ncbi:hypothetical protein POV26_05875 [Aequorivita todarodis]|uniref:hypothetical protein n=1 Tax=Aequorivita todarodis TaxID=2036821 RepID=UPI002350EE23|nr:hypothetical protein [Aequorivita todarodis]MDC8000555.1 hypothetical protein [Aequorivita todarodis]
MKKTLLFFAFIITSVISAQNDEAFVDALVAQKMAVLEMQQNPEYFLRKDYCDGNIQIFILPDGSTCASKSTYYSVYVFWKEGEDVMKVQKFDNCGSFMSFPVAITKNIRKALKDKQALKTEEVKPYKAEKIDNDAYGNMPVQSCHKEYKFVFGGDVFEKKFKEFDLTNDSKYKNVNASHNKSLVLIKLDEEISEMIKHFEESGKFFREN